MPVWSGRPCTSFGLLLHDFSLSLVSDPGTSRVLFLWLWALQVSCMQQKFDKVLEIVSSQSLSFYSYLFLVEKATRGWRPVINLSVFNIYVAQMKFRMQIMV